MEFDTDAYNKIIETHNDVKHIRLGIEKMSCQLDDHEKRIRVLEKCSIEDHEERIRLLEERQNRWLGRNAFIGIVVVVLLQIACILVQI
ncbi:MAG: hypothetical protein Q8J68_08950 [Methanolobus sp.]|uniref:hypothetical protein n=1 Tax=Methanolobus sp. TaxID=1874737 RepID=UPI002731ED42|nr:hypothetical protein [Methanolobus sp.]MDP2217400.1 hypothetical protein [Methanolobus sp.]